MSRAKINERARQRYAADPVKYRAKTKRGHANMKAKNGAAWRARLERKREAGRIRAGLPPATRPCPQLCEACGDPPNGRGVLHLDHDHVTGKFRGWLCHSCNTGLGNLGDNYDGVIRALDYLLRNG